MSYLTLPKDLVVKSLYKVSFDLFVGNNEQIIVK